MYKKILFVISVLAVLLCTTHLTFAHEVYVLTPATIHQDITNPSPDPFSLIKTNQMEFFLGAMIGVILVVGVFLISISRRVESAIDPLLMKIKRYAPIVARLTLGLSLIAAAYYNALFGPEIPLPQLFGSHAMLVRIALYVIGILIVMGWYVWESAFVALLIFIAAVVMYHSYMLTYVNYLGEILINMILAGGVWKRKFEPYAFPILRVLFGISALYASWYAKLFHSQLALDTVTQYHLTHYFHFAPLFVVLGALIIETLIGIFFILGIEIRFTALFFLMFLTLSLFYFGEVVWPHLILIGVNLVFIMHGYDKYSLEGRWFKKGKREPVL
ncbi:MAG: hypothetical protein JWM92_257 [Candidatus Nomurabacteria bacterium]|nr:hypothetical protein [Candidatus Nomurabacteria bacterium]